MTPPQIVTLGTCLALCVPVIGTQVVAHLLRYAPWLGTPWGRLGRLPLYAPWQVAVWNWQHAWHYPRPFEWAMVWMGLWMLASAVLIAWLLKQSGWTRQPFQRDVGWASARDIRKANLFVRVKK